MFYFFFTKYKNEWKKRKFWTQKNNKKKLLQKQKSSQDRWHIDVNKILVSTEEPYVTKNSLKCFVGYNDNDAIRRFCIKLPQMAVYVRKFESNIIMFSNKKLLKKTIKYGKELKNY